MKLVLNIELKQQSRPRFARRGSFTTVKKNKQDDVGKFYSLKPRIEVEVEVME